MSRRHRISRFTNWAGNQMCLPEATRRPRSTSEVAEIVGGAADRDGRVKVVGAGHSFTPAACTDGIMLRLDDLADPIDHDPATGRVTVGAGIRLNALNEWLHGLGLAMPNLGDIAVQSLAGATATATHGTGIAHGNLSTAIVGFEIVTGNGEVMWCDADTNPEIFAVGRVGVGALGVITRMRVQCVPSFVLHATERGESIDGVFADWDGFARSADHAELFWFPGVDRCFTKRNRRTDDPERPPSRMRYIIDKELGENVALEAAVRAVRAFPARRDLIVTTATKVLGDRDVVDRSYRVFASPRRVRFVEMEYGVPFDALPEAFERIRRFTESLDRRPLFPIEVRASAADDIPLSTGEGRASGWIAVHQDPRLPSGDYFRGVEAIADDYAGRPHWGKLHFQTHDVLRERYARWDQFAAVRARLDPAGVFRNDYVDRVLGPIG